MFGILALCTHTSFVCAHSATIAASFTNRVPIGVLSFEGSNFTIRNALVILSVIQE